MFLYLENPDGTKPRFWSLEVRHKTVTTRTGPVGSVGRATVSEHRTVTEARAGADEKQKAKLDEGFVSVDPPSTPPPEDLSSIALDELVTRSQEAVDEKRFDDLVPICTAILARDPDHAKSQLRLALMLTNWERADRVELEDQPTVASQLRRTVLNQPDLTPGNRQILTMGEVLNRARARDLSTVAEGFEILDNAVAQGVFKDDFEDQVAAARSSLWAQRALLHIEAAGADVEVGLATLYHLLCRDLGRRAIWDSALDQGVRDRHLGAVLDQVPTFPAWVLQQRSPPPVPEALVSVVGTMSSPPAAADGLLLLVAGQKNYYKSTHLPDTWAPGRTARLAFLLHAGASVDAVYAFEESSPLHLVAACGDADAVRFLVSQGADVEGRDKRGETPLFRAAAGRQTAAAILALGALGADVDAVAESGRTAIYAAAYNGNDATIAALKTLGADLDAACGIMTPIEMPARNDNFAAAKALLDHGATPTTRALDEATTSRSHRVGHLLRRALAVTTGSPSLLVPGS